MVTSGVSGCHGVGCSAAVDNASGGRQSAVEVDNVVGHRSLTTNASYHSQLNALRHPLPMLVAINTLTEHSLTLRRVRHATATPISGQIPPFFLLIAPYGSIFF